MAAPGACFAGNCPHGMALRLARGWLPAASLWCTKGHELAFEPTVVEAALFVGASAEAALKAWMLGDGTERPAGMAAQQLAHLFIERLAALAVAEPLAVGRIAQKDAR